MLSNVLFNRTALPDIEKSLNVYSLRQKTISNNIANVLTPGYKALKVNFEEEYRETLYSTQMSGALTHEKHFPIGPKTFSQVHPAIDFKEDTLNDSGLNNVDIDKEMAELAENMLRYEMSTRLVTKKLTLIKSAIRGRA